MKKMCIFAEKALAIIVEHATNWDYEKNNKYIGIGFDDTIGATFFYAATNLRNSCQN